MPFPWFSIAKYSGVVLSFSGLGAGVCSLIHEKPEEIKNEEQLPEEIEKQLEEALKTNEEGLKKVAIEQETLENVTKKFNSANKRNVAYANVVDCFIGEQKRLIEDKKYNSQFFSWSSSRRDVTPKYNKCYEDHPIPKSASI